MSGLLAMLLSVTCGTVRYTNPLCMSRRGAGAAGSIGVPVSSACFLRPSGGVGEQVVGEAGGHEPRAGQRQRDAGRVDGDPPPAPLLRDVGRRAAAARRVEDEVAGVGRHQDAARDNRCGCLDDVNESRPDLH